MTAVLASCNIERKYYLASFTINGKIKSLRVSGDNSPEKARALCEHLVKDWRRKGDNTELIDVKEKLYMFVYDKENGDMSCLSCGNVQKYPRDGWWCKTCGQDFLG